MRKRRVIQGKAENGLGRDRNSVAKKKELLIF